MAPKIVVTYDPSFDWEPWTAYDENTFEVAPNKGLCPLGIGKTQEEAIQDLLDQIIPEGEPC
jgi:hypothetical protein